MRSGKLLGGLLLLAACDPWGFDPDKTLYTEGDLWDPAVLPVEGGAYVRLPQAGALALVRASGEAALVDLQGARADHVAAAPDGRTVLVSLAWDTCADDDPKIEYLEDCAEEDQGVSYELAVVRDGAVAARLSVPPQFRRYAFSADGAVAAASLDPGTVGTMVVDGLLNPDAVVFIDLASGEATSVPVGFPPESVLFAAEGGRAIALSRSQVAVIDLAAMAVTVTFPLSLDSDQAVEPSDVAMARGGRYALVTVAGRPDLYVLDLEQESIDIVELSAAPTDMLVDEAADRTILAYGGAAWVDVVEHDFFEVSRFALEEPVDRVSDGADRELLYSVSGARHDAYRFDALAGELEEVRAENPIRDLRLNADRTIAVALMDPDSSGGGGAGAFYDQSYCLGVIPLASGADPVTLVLQGPPVGLEIAASEGTDRALVLMEGVDSLLSVDLQTGGFTPLDLSAPPRAIDTLPDGTFVIAHDRPMGLLSFFDPATGDIRAAANFATLGLLADDRLIRREE